MEPSNTREVLRALKRLQATQEISIIKLSEPITSFTPSEARQRTSDASSSSVEGPTPSSLDADLTHYSELFSKLRFSYVEQVTKEKFIRAIVGEPPLIVTMQENIDLEKDNAEAKAQLKNLKLEVADMVERLEKKGRELSKRYTEVQLETRQLEELPLKIEQLEEQVERLRAKHAVTGSSPGLNLPLNQTKGLISKRMVEQQDLARELESLRSNLPRKRKEAERLEAELGPLEAKRLNSLTAAMEARRRKDAALGGMADDLEQRARWWRASESVLRRVLDIPS